MHELDEGARTLGTFYIWSQIIGALITLVVSTIAAILVFIFFRRGWVTEKKKVDTVSCKDDSKKKEDCKDGSCSTHRCTITFEGMDGVTVEQDYPKESLAPKKGDEVETYYDPGEVNKTITLSSSPKLIIVIVLIILSLGSLIYLVFLMMIRNNKTAQRVGGAMGALSLVESVLD